MTPKGISLISFLNSSCLCFVNSRLLRLNSRISILPPFQKAAESLRLNDIPIFLSRQLQNDAVDILCRPTLGQNLIPEPNHDVQQITLFLVRQFQTILVFFLPEHGRHLLCRHRKELYGRCQMCDLLQTKSSKFFCGISLLLVNLPLEHLSCAPASVNSQLGTADITSLIPRQE